MNVVSDLPNIDEHWKPVAGFEGLYEVSDLGRVRSLDRTVVDKNGSRTRVFRGRVLTNICGNTGYHCVSLHKNNVRVTRRQVQRLVAEAFLGTPPLPDMWVDHKNGIRSDNRVENLRWVKPSTNNNNTPYTRYLRRLLIQAGIQHMSEDNFSES